MRWIRTGTVVAVLVVLGGARLAGSAPTASGGNRCPEIKGSRDPSDPSYVHELFWDIHRCQVPLREGTGHIPRQDGDFGYRHIVSRRTEGAGNHEVTDYAKSLWQQALLRAGKMVGRDYFCHSTHYTSGKREKTMRVFVHYRIFHGYRYKGITSAYWVSGRRGC